MKKITITLIVLALFDLSLKAQTAYITNSSGNSVSVINIATNTVTATITVGTFPWGVSVSPDGSKVYVADWHSNTVSVINTATNAVSATIAVGNDPFGVSVSPDGSKAYVVNIDDNTVSVISTATNTVTATITVGTHPYGVSVSPDGSKVFITNYGANTVSVINTSTGTVTATITVGPGPIAISVSPDGSKAYIANYNSNTVSVINTATNTVSATITVGTSPQGISVSPDGSKVYVPNEKSNSVSVINTATNNVSATITVGTVPVGVSISPDGSKVYVANNDDNTVSVINSATNNVAATIGVGNGPVAFGNFISTYNYNACPTPKPVATNASRCGAGSVILMASGGTQYLWYNAASGGNLVNTGATFTTPSLSTTTTYYVSNFDSCESARIPVTAFINTLNVNAGNNQNVSCGDSIALNPTINYNGSLPLTFTWSPSTGLSSSTIRNPKASPSQTTTYTVMVSDSICTSYSDITITPTPANFGANFTSNTQILYNPPFAIQFNNTTPNMSNYNFTWYFGDGASLQSNNATVFHQYAQNGLYDVTLVATNIATGCSQTKYQSGYIYCAGGTSCTQTATIAQTNPVNGCVGVPVKLSCNTVVGATYQWNYNGSTISGYDTTVYYANASGNYSVTIILNSCPVTSSVITVTLNNPPTVPVITSNGSLTYCGGGKDTLTATAGASSYLWSNGATTQSTVITASGNYTVQISDAEGCKSQSQPYLVGASPLANPDICIVSIDSATGHNIIIWNKTVTTAINHYNIYSQGNQANVFNLLHSIPYSSMSTYIDSASNPAQQAYMYKLSSVDTCGAESALSSYQETIHLSINQGMGNTYNLLWNFYEGFSFPSYNIYRGTSLSNITLLTTLASTLNSYTDLTPPSGYVYYQIEAVNPNPCSPMAKSVHSKNYSSSRSNIASNYNNIVITGINNHDDNLANIRIYPNPANDQITIDNYSFAKNQVISIYDIQGQRLMQQPMQQAKTNIDISAFATGVYFVKINTENGVKVEKFVKE